MKDLYAVLGIDVDASATEIREAYRKLSKKFHPDLNENDVYFENRFKEIRQAYELLSDPVGKLAYDNQLKQFATYPTIAPSEHKAINKSSVGTKINWAFTAMLLILTALFGYYVVRSIAPSKITKVTATQDVANTTAPAVTHHKKHHHKQVSAAETGVTQTTAKPVTDTINARTVKPSIARTLAPTQVIAAPKAVVQPAVQQPKPMPVQSTTVVSARPAQNNTPTTSTPKSAAVTTIFNPAPATSDAYIKANATGIVYMRQMNNYNSEVLASIPGDTKVTVLEKGGNFYKISYNNKTGYVPNWTVQFR